MDKVRQFAAFVLGSLLCSSLPAQTFSDWTAPINLGTTINSTTNDV